MNNNDWMMNDCFSWTKQSNFSKEIKDYECSTISGSESCSPAQRFGNAYSFLNYDYYYFPSIKMTEEEYNEKYWNGQRIFFMEDESYKIILKIEKYDEVVEKYKSDLYKKKMYVADFIFDELECHLYNATHGDRLITLDHLKEMVEAIHQWQEDSDNKALELKFKKYWNIYDK